MGRILPVALCLLASALGLRAQTSEQREQAARPPFRGGVEIVDVDVSVLDKHRQPVLGLTAADFTVLEDGKVRPIVAFTPVDLPPRELPPAPWMAEVAPDLQTNDLQREGRLVVVLFDRSIAILDVEHARTIAEAAIEQLRPADLAAVVYSEYGVPQNFTADRRRLLAAIRQPSTGLPEGDNGDSGSCFCGTCTLERITQVADAIRDVRQRRKILFVVGSNLAVTARGACSPAIADARDRALRAVGAANLTVHVLDPSGVRTLMANASSSRPTNRGGLANLQRMGNLMILPDHTGGRALFGNTPAGTLPALFRESNTYYVLGFTPAHADGRFHDITVKVGRRDVILQARRGYYAAGGRPAPPAKTRDGVSPALQAAITGLWPKADLPLTMTATPFAMPGLQTAAVIATLGVEGRGAERPTNGASLADARFNVLVGAFDRNGRRLAYAQGTIADAPRRLPGQAPGYDLLARLELRPGRYELRAAVEDGTTGEVGSVYTYVDVPNYLTEFLSLSGIFLRTTPTDAVGALSNAGTSLPFVPTLRREFTSRERVTAWLEIYQGIRRQAMPGYILAELRDEHDTRVFHQETRTVPGDVGPNRAIRMDIDLPLNQLSPGRYLLNVEIRQGNNTARRDLRLTIR